MTSKHTHVTIRPDLTRFTEAFEGVREAATYVVRVLGAMPCLNPAHRRETTTRTGWTVKWTACPHCVARIGGRR